MNAPVGSLAGPLTESDRETMKASNGMTIVVNDDGSIDIEHVKPAVHRKRNKDADFGENLAETLSDGTLNDIANDYIDGVSADIQSRSDFIQNYNKGIDLLGLKLDEASSSRGNRTSLSRVKAPALLKACVRSQSNSRGQLLPAAGPCKVQTISGETQGEDDVALNFQNDFNYFLTDVDKGYYSDTDRMLFYRAFGGCGYKKIYRDPILRRPTSRFTSLDSLIVSEDARDLESALRKTNELLYSPVEVARMQRSGAWLEHDLGTPMQNISPARRKMMESQGLSAATTRSQDISFTIYEGYWAFDAGDYGFDDPMGAGDGMPCPYRVTLDRDSRKVLALHRNWKKEDKEIFAERQVFVKYGMVPGLGFMDYGFLHMIGNQTRVLTAIWQIMIDKGMLSNWPGGMKVKGVRTATNELNPGLGEWVEVDIGSLKSIKDAMMGMPYGSTDEGLMKLAETLLKDIEGMSGTLEIPSGQGTTNTPAGTILAIIEQQAQDLTAVQQRDHRAQREELRLLRDLFNENPDDLKLLQRKNRSKIDWATKVQEFMDLDLQPASDPNVPSQAHRILLNQFLVSLAEKAPNLFGSNLQKVAERVLKSVGINDAKDLLAPRAEFLQSLKSMGQKGGNNAAGAASLARTKMELPLKQAQLKLQEEELAEKREENQRQAANEASDSQLRGQKQATELAHAEAQEARDERQMQHEHALETNEASGLDVQAQADLNSTNAGTLASMGSAAASFAKAGETVAEGERDLKDFEDGTVGGIEPPKPAASLSQAKGGSKKAKAASKKSKK